MKQSNYESIKIIKKIIDRHITENNQISMSSLKLISTSLDITIKTENGV